MPSQLRPRVLVSNDDGPPGPESPFIEPFIDALEKKLGWDIKVAVPTTQVGRTLDRTFQRSPFQPLGESNLLSLSKFPYPDFTRL